MTPRRLLPLAGMLLGACTLLQAAPAADAVLQAVAAARPGATVTVPPGVHHLHLVLDRPLTLAGAPGAVLDGDGTGSVVTITAPGVTVRGLVVRHSGSDLTATDAGIRVGQAARGAQVLDNRIEDVLFGVYLDGPAAVDVRGNTIVGMPGLRPPDRGDGIHLWNDTGCTIAHNDVSGTRDGIYVYISPDNVIRDNHIHGVRYGVHYMYSKHNELTGNVSHDNTAGFALMASDHLRVVGNRAYRDMSYGILLNYINDSEIRGNEIRGIAGQFDADGNVIVGAEGKALFVYLSQGNAIVDNLLADSRIGIHVTAGSNANRIVGNAFLGNRTQVMYVQNAAQEWSRPGHGNYWSNYAGWDLDGNGIGDVPYRPNDGVDALMWKYPDARLLMSSPSVLLLRYVQRAFPVFATPGVSDHFPLMAIPAAWRGHQP
ncbi:MAG: nitrous oxide reductase family maturation protein NosD [Rhodanobacter sp.]|nr:MAG: nitrous oxide reductase family maturation protein NosD [Rhodanobacter sp.]TAM09936.1 MAG: nitrous oxide reductase family maturation protein NosD [Rhodanobacter sp.]TAM36725.1 MAG: nitrous oxide reductase family maturation protein NosD [Rhodanobacter sp.]